MPPLSDGPGGGTSLQETLVTLEVVEWRETLVTLEVVEWRETLVPREVFWVSFWSCPGPCCRRNERLCRLLEELCGRARERRRVHEGHGPAGTSSPRASDHAGGRLGVEVGSVGGGLDDTEGRLRKGSRDSLSFLLLGVCVNDCGRRLWGKVKLY